jgi:hypothetical protein
MASPQDQQKDSMWAWAMMEPELSEREKALRDKFCEEYIKDENEYKACSRVGFAAAFVPEMAKLFMRESYVTKKIRAMQEEQLHGPEKDAKQTARDIAISVYKEVALNKFEKGAARVAAASGLVNLHGIAAPTKSQVDVNHRGGVLMVPAIASLNDWESIAMATQRGLVSDVRN